jgi:hypothetical protein
MRKSRKQVEVSVLGLILFLLFIQVPPGRAEDNRWGGSGSAPTLTPLDPPRTSSGAARRKILKLNERVPAVGCVTSPVSCICPPESFKITFYESPKWGGKSERMLTCIPQDCPDGTMPVQRTATGSGKVSFRCEKPGQTNGKVAASTP